MKSCKLIGFAWAALLLLAAQEPCLAAMLPKEGMEAVLGAPLNPQGDVLRATWGREDVKVTVDKVPLPVAAGLTSWAAFTSAGRGAVVMGDTVVFQDEVDAAMDAALAEGLQVTALHNHFAYDQPRVLYLHLSGRGEPVALAGAVHAVWSAIKGVRAKRAVPVWGFGGTTPEDADEIDAKAIGRITGLPAKSAGGVVKVETGREGKMNGVPIGDAMGLNTWAAFQGSDRRAAVDGDFIMTGDEVQPVLKALRKAGIHVVALHNHMIGEEPRFYFLHFWGQGAAGDLARGLRAALDAQQSAAR